MRFLGFLCLIGIFNAFYWGIKNEWMFDPTSRRGGSWWLADAGIGVICLILGPLLWNAARIRSRNRLAATSYRHARGEVSEAELHRLRAEHEREFGQQ